MKFSAIRTKISRIRANNGFVRVFAGGIVNQILLSGASFLTGLILIRGSSETQYGYYVLIMATVPLLVQLQGAFLQPPLTAKVTHSPEAERRSYIGGLFAGQRRLLLGATIAAVIACLVARFSTWLTSDEFFICISSVLATAAWLFRDFFRMALNAYRRPFDVLRADSVYAVLLVAGAYFATYSQSAAALAALSIALASLLGGVMLSRMLWSHDPWATSGDSDALSKSVRIGTWAAVGAGIHWTFNQGYNYVVAANLDVAALAATSATRLTLMPIGLFSLGISGLMFPTASLWLRDHGRAGLLKRLLAFSFAMACLTIIYIAILWNVRDWVFLNVMRRDFPQRDLLLKIWSLTFLSTIVRDQLIFFLIVQNRFKLLAALTFVCALIGVSASYVAIQQLGPAGGPLGLMAGELSHVIGIMLLTTREVAASPVHVHGGRDLPAG